MIECSWDSRPLYDKLIGPLREKARELGYAIGVHGTLKRDIDLIACPWTAGAVDARTLADALFKVVKQVNGIAHWSWNPSKGTEFTLDGCPGVKPHGRLGWVINLTMESGPYIDLAVMPRATEQAEAELARLKRGDLTTEEFHALCHHAEERPGCTIEDHRHECAAYRRKIFGAE